MKPNHVITLKKHTINGTETIAQVSQPLTVDEACKQAEALNKQAGFVCGGFGQWYAVERAA
jgi:hypothetical protein